MTNKIMLQVAIIGSSWPAWLPERDRLRPLLEKAPVPCEMVSFLHGNPFLSSYPALDLVIVRDLGFGTTEERRGGCYELVRALEGKESRPWVYLGTTLVRFQYIFCHVGIPVWPEDYGSLEMVLTRRAGSRLLENAR